MTLRFGISLAAAAVLAPAIASADMIEYSGGHGDVGLAVEDDGSLFLHYHFGSGSVLDRQTLADEAEYDPSEVYVRVGDAAMLTPTSGVSYLGTGPGEPIWELPQSSTAGLPFLGIAAEELSPANFSSATLQLIGFSGPDGGEFALGQGGGSSGTQIFFQTNDGITTADMLSLTIGEHDHYFWAFSEMGVYDLNILAQATTQAGVTLSDTGTLRFAVGSATAVPEPASLACLAAAATGFWVRRRRLAKRSSVAELA